MAKWFQTLTLTIALVFSSQVSATVPTEAAKFIEGLGTQAIALLSQPGQPSENSENQVRSLLSENFDLDRIGQFVVGRYWETMSSDQQKAYLDVFREFVLRSYSRRFGGYAGSKFAVVGSQPGGRDDVIVLTQIIRPDDPNVDAGWRVTTEDGQLKIVDVIISGVSMAMTQRSDFTTAIRREGVDTFIGRLRAQLAGLQQPGDKPRSALDAPTYPITKLNGLALR